jgi:hypothetical protein
MRKLRKKDRSDNQRPLCHARAHHAHRRLGRCRRARTRGYLAYLRSYLRYTVIYEEKKSYFPKPLIHTLRSPPLCRDSLYSRSRHDEHISVVPEHE